MMNSFDIVAVLGNKVECCFDVVALLIQVPTHQNITSSQQIPSK